MAVIPAGYAQCNVRFTGTPVPNGAEITFGVAIGDKNTAEEVFTGVSAALTSSGFLAPFTSNMTATSVLVKLGPNLDGPMQEFPIHIEGLATTEGLSPNTACLVRKGGALGGRMNQGRLFIPGVPEGAATNDGKLSSGFLSAAQTGMTALRDDLLENGVEMVILHSEGGTSRPPVSVLTLTVQSVVATQRRRLRR